MSKINSMMDIGKRSMMNNQTALQTVGHNIANRSTEGFTRQRVDVATNEAIGQGKLRMGTGSKTAMVSRVGNPYLEKQIGKERATLGYHQGMADALSRVEQVYNEQMNKGLNTTITDFFNSFREFSNNPESLSTRTQLKESGVSMAKGFHRINNDLREIQKDVDQQMLVQINDVNEMSREIASLNEKIHMIEVQGGPANDERDRRDLLLKKLGEKVNIRWTEGHDGMVTVTAGNSALMVAGYEAKRLEVRATPESATKAEGAFDVFYYNTEQSEPIKVTEQVTGGSIGGLLEVRDKTIEGLIGDLDQMAFGMKEQVNGLHRKGFNAFNEQGVNFFAELGDVRHASVFFDLDEQIKDDPSKIVAAAQAGSPADNRIANMISQLQYQGTMNDGSTTFDEYYNSMVGKVGIQARRTEHAQESQANIVRQLGNIRESISGVSLDEEATKMIEYQKAFDASARLVKTADEMLETVLSLKRM
jgi:flagellar hook-associated protein 1 FlgK